MKLFLNCTSNSDEMSKVNAVNFKLKSGSVLTIDSPERAWCKEKDGSISSVWRNCYLWALDDRHIFGSDGHEPESLIRKGTPISELNLLLKDSEIWFTYDDEADADYEMTIVSWEAGT